MIIKSFGARLISRDYSLSRTVREKPVSYSADHVIFHVGGFLELILLKVGDMH